MEKGLYISYEWLIKHGVIRKSIENWIERKQVVSIKIGNNAHVLYGSIPAPTRAKLPSKESIIKMQQRERDERYAQGMYERLYPAMENMYPTYWDIYLKYKLPLEKVLEYSKKHAVLEEVLTIKDECTEEKCRFPLRDVWQAFCKIFPNWYAYEAFCHAIRVCINEGIERLLIKKYVPAFTKFDARYEKMILDCMSSQSRFNQPQIHKKICKVCDAKGWEKPSLSWVKTTFRRLAAISYPGCK